MRISHKTYPLSSWRREVLAASMAALFSLPCFCQTGSVQNARGKMKSLAEQDSKVEMFERSCIRRLKEAEFSHSKTVFKGFFFFEGFLFELFNIKSFRTEILHKSLKNWIPNTCPPWLSFQRIFVQLSADGAHFTKVSMFHVFVWKEYAGIIMSYSSTSVARLGGNP